MKNKKHFKSVICLLLTVLMLFSVALVAGAADTVFAQVGAGETVYFRNSNNWSPVKAYVWSDSNGEYKPWSGEEMTLFKDNVYKYVIPGDYNKIIFTNGNGAQTADLTVPGDGYIYDGSNWSAYPEHGGTPTQPSTQPSSGNNNNPTVDPNPDGNYVYVRNAAGWGKVNAYMWKDGAGENAAWPGKAMESIGSNIYRYNVTGNFNMIIFNDGGTQTDDMQFPGANYLYDNKTGQWEQYIPSDISVLDYKIDADSTIYKNMEVVLSTKATSVNGAVSYKFSVSNGSSTTVLRDYSSVSTATWVPTAAGSYTLIFEYKDAKGETNKKSIAATVVDDAGVAEPIIKKVTPGSSQVKVNANMNIAVTAGGGKTGTNLLFYKYTIKDATGKVVNVPYYTKNASYTYKPSALGKFTVTVSVQNSDNALIERTYDYEAVNNVQESTEGSTNTTNPNPSGLLGDADNDSVLSVMDATEIQRYAAQLISKSDFRYDLSDYDKDGNVSVMDATSIQLKLAGL